MDKLIGKLTAIPTVRGTLTGEAPSMTGVISHVILHDDPYEGPYTVTPLAFDPTILPTADKVMLNDVTVTKVPFYKTTNITGGYTAYIAETTYGN